MIIILPLLTKIFRVFAIFIDSMNFFSWNMTTTYPWYWFDTTSSDIRKLEKTSRKAGAADKGRRLRCRICEHVITFETLRVSIDGSHEHIRSNPHGCEFHFECFENAPGCSTFGSATAEHSWFRGCKWQIAVCGECGEHLGWLFHGDINFYGLISVRLVREGD